MYSQTSLIRTPKGQSRVSVLERCPLHIEVVNIRHFKGSTDGIKFLFFLSQNTAQTRSISPRSVGDMLLLKLIERLEKCFDLTENPDVRKDSFQVKMSRR